MQKSTFGLNKAFTHLDFLVGSEGIDLNITNLI
jgi:hypothetical protein